MRRPLNCKVAGSQILGHGCPSSPLLLYCGSSSCICFFGQLCHILVAQTVKKLPTMWETQVWSLSCKDPLEKERLQTWQSDFERRKRRILFVVPGVHLNFSKNGSLYLLCSTLLVIFVLRTSLWHLCVLSCMTLDLMDCCMPSCCVHGILQAKILEWVAT